MSIVVNPHNKEEEAALLAFLDRMQFDYSREDDTIMLSELQKQEILERDKQYESGESDTYMLNEIVAHFKITE